MRGAPDRFDPSAHSYAATSLSDEPQTLHEVRHRPDAARWDASMCEEMRSLQEKLVYKLTELPQGQKALPSRWVYKVKRDEQGRVMTKELPGPAFRTHRDNIGVVPRISIK